MKQFQHQSIAAWATIVLMLLMGSLVLTACAAQPVPTATPLPPTATVPPTQEAAAASDEILLVTGEFPPLTSESLENGGLSVEIVRMVFAEMGRPVRFEFYPWERAEAMVASGEAWGAFPYVPTEERRTRYLVSDPISYGRTMLFYYGDRLAGTEYTELSDLQPFRMGVSLGYWYITPFQEAGLNLDEANDDVANLRKLQAGRIDLVPVYEVIGRWLIQNNFPDDTSAFNVLEKPLSVDADTVIVSRDYADSETILQEFNAALAVLQVSDAYAEIFANYGIEPATAEGLAAS
jgi:polar amino acid transport system substrate-binding protein